ncbi:OmpA family protein [Tenacibaculum maritimum]|uniref:OmpA family protein n=1 Tax=Tenacibaculum maritimum TaxID=107401 RepID=UPI0038775716
MKHYILIFVALLVTTFSFGQRKYAADRYFKEYSYKKASKLYKRLYDRGDRSQLVLERLGDCHYLNSETKEASHWYGELLSKYASSVSPEYLFKYAQSLKSNGEQSLSDSWMLKFNALQKEDSRGGELLTNKNYFSAYTNKPDTYLNIHNLSSNTKYSDFGGFIQGNKFYFASSKPVGINSRLYKWNKQPYLNLYKSVIELGDIEGSLDDILDVNDVESLKSPIATEYHESNAIFTKDGQTMYFTRNNYDGKRLHKDKKRTSRLKIYKSILKNGEWTTPEELPFNNPSYSVGHPALSVDEQTLYFVSDMPGGLGSSDIYKVSIEASGGYGKPENLGRPVNTEGREMFPFIGSDETLYFSSDGHLGLGLLDIFESKKENGIYVRPENLGSPTNSNRDDFCFILNKELNKGFFSSNREGGKGDDDIYSFLIYDCTQSIVGIVTDTRTGASLAGATVKLIDESGAIVMTKETDQRGKYTFEKVDCKSNYVVLAEKLDYKSAQKKVVTNSESNYRNEADLGLTPLIIEDQIVINPIYFDFDKWNIREDAAYELEHIVSVMNNHPNMVIKIESHTDSRGSKLYNRKLSDNRAKSTRDYLISRGIEGSRIASAIGYGEDQLLNHCDDAHRNKCSEEEHQLNRRSYFYIVKK